MSTDDSPENKIDQSCGDGGKQAAVTAAKGTPVHACVCPLCGCVTRVDMAQG